METIPKSLLENFSRKFGHFLSSGIPLVHSLDIIASEAPSKEFSEILQNIVVMIKNGKRFSEAISEYPCIFSKSYVGMARAGEGQGTLDIMMNKISDGLRDGLIVSGQGKINSSRKEITEGAGLIDEILMDAILKGASDIHIVPLRDRSEVQFRIDGRIHIMRELVRNQTVNQHDMVVARLKDMCACDPAERKIPQDGRILIKVKDRNYDIRICFLPTCIGEKVTLRLLDKSEIILTPSQIIPDPEDLEKFNKLVELPLGMIIAGGPSGCGKTTTLYSALTALKNAGGRAIATVEDPVEYLLDGAAQVQVTPKIGLDFSSALNSIMRSDPDVVMVGEIRDDKTMLTALKVAVTGHQLWASINCDDVIDMVRRLYALSPQKSLLSSALSGLISQRLVRKICKKCAVPIKRRSVVQELASLGITNKKEASILEGKGCDECNHTGYRGRMPVFEIYIPDKNFKEVLISSDLHKLVEFMECQKYRRFKASVADMVTSGLTTPIEALRVFGG